MDLVVGSSTGFTSDALVVPGALDSSTLGGRDSAAAGPSASGAPVASDALEVEVTSSTNTRSTTVTGTST